MANRFLSFTRAIWRSALGLLIVGVFSVPPSFAAEPETSLHDYDFETCNWLVTYRNRTYDLSPLTRAGLARPVEGDLRSVLARVPEANLHLENVVKQGREAKFHSIVGTASIMALVGSRIAHSNGKDKGESKDALHSLNVVSLISGLFFLKATYDSGRATRATKTELMEAVKAFNARSPHKIEPARKGGP